MFSPLRFRLLVAVVVALSMLCAVPLRAEILDGLYEVSVTVPNQSERERRLALGQALEQVLVRASGQSLSVLQANPVVQVQRSKAEDYLLEYRYGTARLEPGSTAKPAGSLLTARFSPTALRTLLAQAGLPLWPRSRPTLLVWWQVEERGQRKLVVGEPFLAEATRRGLPVIFPMNDLQDRQHMEGLWSFDAETLSRVVDRYGISAVLVGRSRTDVTGSYAQWQLHLEGRVFTFPAPLEGAGELWHEGEILGDLAVVAVDSVVGQLLPYYGVDLGGSPQQAEVVVEGISSFEAYSVCLRTLQGLEAVRSVALQRATGQALDFQLVYDGRPDVLRRALSAGRVLVELSDTLPVGEPAAAAMTGSPPLRFRYVRP